MAGGQWSVGGRTATIPNICIRWSWWSPLPFTLACFAVTVSYLWTHGFPAIALVVQRGFALVCHQHAERSFFALGGAVAVCARCLGIYLGAALGLLLRMPRRVARRLLMFAVLLNLVDTATEVSGLHGNWLGVRFMLGLLLGAAGAALVVSCPLAISRPCLSPVIPTNAGDRHGERRQAGEPAFRQFVEQRTAGS